MKPICNMSKYEKLWAKVLLQWIIDAIDGPIKEPPSDGIRDLFGNVPISSPVTEFYRDEYESRMTSRADIMNLSDNFVHVCELVDANPVSLRDRIKSGSIDRQEVIELFTAINR